MKIRVLGASGGAAPGRPPTSFLVDGRLAVDAGAVATVLELDEQALVHDVLTAPAAIAEPDPHADAADAHRAGDRASTGELQHM